MLKFNCGEFQVSISQLADYALGSQLLRRETCLSEDDYHLASHHGVTVFKAGEEVSSHLLAADRGATGIHDHSALIHGARLFLAIGGRICALEIPSLDVIWNTEVDWATCFGVHLAPNYECLISHGELEMSRLDFDGQIQWQSSGADIFTGSLTILADSIEVEDWNGSLYSFEIATGKSRKI